MMGTGMLPMEAGVGLLETALVMVQLQSLMVYNRVRDLFQ
jgi:hypothetical protein